MAAAIVVGSMSCPTTLWWGFLFATRSWVMPTAMLGWGSITHHKCWACCCLSQKHCWRVSHSGIGALCRNAESETSSQLIKMRCCFAGDSKREFIWCFVLFYLFFERMKTNTKSMQNKVIQARRRYVSLHFDFTAKCCWMNEFSIRFNNKVIAQT